MLSFCPEELPVVERTPNLIFEETWGKYFQRRIPRRDPKPPLAMVIRTP